MEAKAKYILSFIFILIYGTIIGQDTSSVDQLEKDTVFYNPEESTSFYEEEETNEGIEMSRIFLLGIDLNILKPIDLFFEDNQSARYGVSFQFLTQIKKEKALFLGLSTGINFMESTGGSYIEIDDGIERDISWVTSTKFIPIYIDARYYLDVDWWKFEPYVEGLFGGNMIYTRSDFTDALDEDYGDSELHKLKFGSVYGLGIGTHFVIDKWETETNSTYLDFRVRYMQGAPMTYYQKIGSGSVYDGIDNFKLTNSQVNFLTYDIGIILKF